MGWQVLAHYHCKVCMVKLNDAPASTQYLSAQPLAKRRRDA
jgi:hypothetical protein